MVSDNQQFIGGSKNFWLYSDGHGYDLTHPLTPGLGHELGLVNLDDGSKVDAGKVLMTGSWNVGLYKPLAEVATADDVPMRKNRLTAFIGTSVLEHVLNEHGIRTLIFAGCNTDQCVGATLLDAVAGGYDCLLLSDGCATSSSQYAQQCFEYNMMGWGFLMSCKEFADSIFESNDGKPLSSDYDDG